MGGNGGLGILYCGSFLASSHVGSEDSSSEDHHTYQAAFWTEGSRNCFLYCPLQVSLKLLSSPRCFLFPVGFAL